MKAALGDNRKNRILYSLLVWKGLGIMAHLQASHCAGYKLGCPSNSSSTDKWIEYEQ